MPRKRKRNRRKQTEEQNVEVIHDDDDADDIKEAIPVIHIDDEPDLTILNDLKEAVKLKKQNQQNEINKLKKENAMLKELLKKQAYAIDDIVDTVNDKERQESKEIVQEQSQIDTHNTTLTKHDGTLNEWNKQTQQLSGLLSGLNKQGINYAYATKNKDNQGSGGWLYNEHVSCIKITNQQSQRLESVPTDSHIIGLLRRLKNINSNLAEYSHSSESEKQSLQKLCDNYNDIKDQRISKQKLIENEVKECNILIGKENALFVSNHFATIKLKEIDGIFNQYKTLSSSCGELVKKYEAFTETNNENIDKSKKIFKEKWNKLESEWMSKWDLSDLVFWFKYKCIGKDVSNTNWTNIESEMKKQNMKIVDLIDTGDQTALYLLGITDYNIRMHLIKQIQFLRTKFPLNANVDNNNDDADDDKDQEGCGIPPKFICPISNQIMRDPVVAFDGFTYERSEIVKYLKEQKKSPKTGDSVSTMSLFPNMQLKREISSFKVVEMRQNGNNHEGEEDTMLVD